MEKKLSRQELFDLVWTEPILTLSKKFDISDVGLRKICSRFNIPTPKSGHWQRVRAKKMVTRPDLPAFASSDEIILTETENPYSEKKYPWTQRQIEIESDPRLN